MEEETKGAEFRKKLKECISYDGKLSKQAEKEWNVDRRQIRLRMKLQDGRFSEVWEGVWNRSTRVAVKAVKPGTMFLQEAVLMMCLQHPNVIQLYAVSTQEEPIYLVTELPKFGNLLEYLKGGDGQSLKLPQLIEMCMDIVGGMVYLESLNCIHRNLAARNILVTDKRVCKLANFGSARVLDDREPYVDSPSAEFPIKWTAPEGAFNHQFTVKSDVWSFGIVLCEVITYGRPPYPGMTNAQVLEKVPQGYRMTKPPGCPDKLYDIMLQCWSREEPDNRPTFKTLQWQLKEFSQLQKIGGMQKSSKELP